MSGRLRTVLNEIGPTRRKAAWGVELAFRNGVGGRGHLKFRMDVHVKMSGNASEIQVQGPGEDAEERTDVRAIGGERGRSGGRRGSPELRGGAGDQGAGKDRGRWRRREQRSAMEAEPSGSKVINSIKCHRGWQLG